MFPLVVQEPGTAGSGQSVSRVRRMGYVVAQQGQHVLLVVVRVQEVTSQGTKSFLTHLGSRA